jgi:hypothetical protein
MNVTYETVKSSPQQNLCQSSQGQRSNENQWFRDSLHVYFFFY